MMDMITFQFQAAFLLCLYCLCYSELRQYPRLFFITMERLDQAITDIAQRRTELMISLALNVMMHIGIIMRTSIISQSFAETAIYWVLLLIGLCASLKFSNDVIFAMDDWKIESWKDRNRAELIRSIENDR